MSSPIFILGSYHSDFARNLAREQRELSDLVAEVVDGTLQASRISAAEVRAIHVGNAFGQLFTGQAQLGAMPATVRPALWGVPAARHEAACASGSVAVLAATAELEAGRSECALVIGVEQERNVPGETAARYLGAAAWVGHEGKNARFMWPHLFSRLAEHYSAHSEMSDAHLAAFARNAFDNARRNPLAQTRGWRFDEDAFLKGWTDTERNPVIEGCIRRHDCGQVTDGGAGVVLASAGFARAYAERHGLELSRLPRILGFGHRTAGLGLAQKLERAKPEGYLLPHLREAVCDAYRRAGLRGPKDVQGAEVHDCFTITGCIAIDHLGLTAPFESFRAIEDGTITRSGRLPINPSGGLIGLGHPVGATGVRMLGDAARQVRGQAGETQVEGAQRFVTLNIGGSATTVVVFIVGVGDVS